MSMRLLSALMCVLVLGLSGCGFALRGTNQTSHIAPAYQNVQLIGDETPNATALKPALIKHLQLRSIAQEASNNHIRLSQIHFRRYELVGTLTEVHLVLMAEVHYQIGEHKYTYPLQVEHSYQHNEASLVNADNQGEQAKAWLYDALAERIAEQYRAIAQGLS